MVDTPCGTFDVIGDPRLLDPDRRRVAFVGSRASTPYGESVTASLVGALPESYVVVSGGAYGIDAAAHRAALATGHPTVVVLPCGIDQTYPRVHADLFRRVVTNGGAVVSRFDRSEPASRTRFLDRNRTIACLSEGMVVVEASLRSGSLQAARQALDLGRHVMAVPGPLTSVGSEGCHSLIRARQATLVTSAFDILTTLNQGCTSL